MALPHESGPETEGYSKVGRPRDAKCLNAVPSASADRAAQMGPRVGLPFKGRQRPARRRGQKANSYVTRKGGKGETREGRGAGGEAVAGAGEGGVQRGPAGTEHVERVVWAAATQNV